MSKKGESEREREREREGDRELGIKTVLSLNLNKKIYNQSSLYS